ncbi:MAG: hypothetical protein J0M16_02785 [Gammaproteobacteria bacterium]|nr:hypothetical protein [Gammaproteobacteria bacterium]
MNIRATAIVTAGLMLSSIAHASGLMYATGSTDGGVQGLFKIDLNDGHATLIGTNPEGIVGLAFRSDGRLYAGGNGLYIVDPATGNILDEVGPDGMRSLAFNPLNDELVTLSADGSALYTVNPDTGEILNAVFVQSPIDRYAFPIRAITFLSTGQLIGHVGGVVIALDPVTGVGTRIGAPGDGILGFGCAPLGYGASACSNDTLARDENDVLYSFSANPYPFLTSGAVGGSTATVIGPSTLTPPAIYITGIATTVPAPGALPLALTAVGAVAAWSRRRGARGRTGLFPAAA